MITIEAKNLRAKALWSKFDKLIPNDETLITFIKDSYAVRGCADEYASNVIIYPEEYELFQKLRPQYEQKLKDLGYEIKSSLVDKYVFNAEKLPECVYYVYTITIRW